MNEKKVMLLVGCLILVMVSAPGTWAAPPNVPGQPFQQLQNQIDQLSAEVTTLTGIVNTLLGQAVNGSGMDDNFIPRWNDPNTLENSVIFQNDSGKVGIGTIDPEKELHVVGDMKVTGTIFVGDATTEITEDGILFPNGTLQTTAATGDVSESDDPVNWTGTHSWKTHTGTGPGRTLKTFATTIPAQDSSTVISIPVPDNSVMFLLVWAAGIQTSGLSVNSFPEGIGSAAVFFNLGGFVDGDNTDSPIEEIGDVLGGGGLILFPMEPM